jgi:hypothetical protein
MHSARLSLFALVALLGATVVFPLLTASTARADCGPSVSRYGPCAYQGRLLVCGACALHTAGGARSACNPCGTGYACNSKSCAVTHRCAYEYSCDLCGCAWGATGGSAHHGMGVSRYTK